MKTNRIAVIAGDGIGKEVMPEGVRALDAAARKFGLSLAFDHFDWSCDNYGSAATTAFFSAPAAGPPGCWITSRCGIP